MKSKMSILVILFSLVLMCSTVSVYAAPAVEGFMGVSWGASQQQVEAAMAGKGYKNPNPEDRSPTHLIYVDGAFVGQQAEIRFRFIDNRFYSGSARMAWGYNPNEQALQRSLFIQNKALFVGKYGQPDIESQQPAENISNTSVIIGARAKAQWLLNSGEASGDQVEIVIIKQEGSQDRVGKGWSPGDVVVNYENKSLLARLKSSSI